MSVYSRVLFLLLALSPIYVSIAVPFAFHQLIVMNSSLQGYIVRLKGGDKIGSKLTTFITQLPKYGTLFQLSQVYSLYGYHPVSGVPITHNHTFVTGSLHRVYYVPNTRLLCRFCSDMFSFIVTDGTSQSFPGNVTMVDADGMIVGSDFLLGNDGWTILGNKLPVSVPVFEPYSRDQFFHHYIQASDNLVRGKPDKSLWVFNAPSKFLGNFGIAYGGTIQFSISLLAGDVTQLHKGAPLVELECNKRGITLVYPLSAVQFVHLIASFQIALVESSGWLKISRDDLPVGRVLPSKCEFIQVLSCVSGFRILGDLTTWYETIALDNVFIRNGRNHFLLDVSCI
jgi:hypothetical protein